MKTIIGIVIVTMFFSGCVSRKKYYRDIRNIVFSKYDYENRIKALEEFVSEARNREAQSNPYYRK